MRGLLAESTIYTFSFRITPAYAGTTAKRYSQSFGSEDHPCICGDYPLHQDLHKSIPGSPLHMRGLPSLASIQVSLSRITPAYAGTTLKRSRNYLISIIKYPIIYSLYELIFLPELHLQELCEELFHQCHRILKQFLACSYSKINYLFLQIA